MNKQHFRSHLYMNLRQKKNLERLVYELGSSLPPGQDKEDLGYLYKRILNASAVKK
jgi:hypothetical protein